MQIGFAQRQVLPFCCALIHYHSTRLAIEYHLIVRCHHTESIGYGKEREMRGPDRDEERSYMKDYIQKIYGFYGFGLWSVIHTVTGTVIGRAGLSVREGYEIPELGFVTEVAFQHQGYTYEICEAILRYARDELEFPQVQAFCHPENTASLHLLQKLGFTYAGEDLLQGIPHARYIVSLPKSC